MLITSIQPTTFDFLRDIQQNNNREWFNANKERYVTAHADVKSLASALEILMNQHDEIEQLKVYRIYRDVRFSKDKTPYKSSLSGFMSRATKFRRGGYYFHIEPGKSFVGAGFWQPNSSDLARIRREIAASPDELREILADENFKKYFGTLGGNKLKTAPRGYPKDHEAIELLRYKSFLVNHSFTDEEVLQPDFLDKINNVYKAIRPFFNYMSEVLTTDENGAPI